MERRTKSTRGFIMSPIQIIRNDEDIARLTLRNGSGNPLSPDVLDMFNLEMDALLENPPQALIIDTDGASIFSGGFSLPIVASWDRPNLLRFFEGFLDILYKIMRIPCPTMTVIEGHAIAGGFILSLASDMRFLKEGRFKFGLSEVDLGVALPAGAGVLFEWRTSPNAALYYSMTGQLFNTQTAKDIGYANAVVQNPLEEAMKMASALVQKPGKGVGGTRVFFNDRIITEMKKADDRYMEAFLDTWFSTEGQSAIHALAQKLGKK
jgi:enoyl-CoA hydratase